MLDVNPRIIRELAVRIANLEVERASLMVKNELLEKEVANNGDTKTAKTNEPEETN